LRNEVPQNKDKDREREKDLTQSAQREERRVHGEEEKENEGELKHGDTESTLTAGAGTALPEGWSDGRDGSANDQAESVAICGRPIE
jgi:hypothetical protein